jgi:acylphosphatase
MIRSYKIIVKGKVHGVGYRFNAQAKAHQFQLSGFVKNMHDQTVLVHAEGEEDQINRFIDWCYVGPLRAEVIEVHAEETSVIGYQTFEIKK